MVVVSMRRGSDVAVLMLIVQKSLPRYGVWVRQLELCLPRRLCEPTSGKRWETLSVKPNQTERIATADRAAAPLHRYQMH